MYQQYTYGRIPTDGGNKTNCNNITINLVH